MSDQSTNNPMPIGDQNDVNPQQVTDLIDNFDWDDIDYEALKNQIVIFDVDNPEGWYFADRPPDNGLEAAPEASDIRAENLPAQSSSQQFGELSRRSRVNSDVNIPIGTGQSAGNLNQMAPHPQHQMHNLQPPVEAAPARPSVGLYFTNHQEAAQALSQRNVPSSWDPPRPDFTIPSTQHDRDTYVMQLVSAFTDTSGCQDSGSAFSYGGRWANIATGQSDYLAWQIEATCWRILETAITLHIYGPRCLHIFDTGKLATIHKSRNLNFTKRIQLVCELLRLSKSRCETLLGFDDVEMTVGAPAQLITMAKANKKQNAQRDVFLKQGRKVLNGQAEALDQEEVEDEVKFEPMDGNKAPENAFHGHVLEPGVQPALHRYPIQPAVAQDADVKPEISAGGGHEGKNKRRYDEYDESQDEMAPYANKRMR